jgi:hypothetical protein
MAGQFCLQEQPVPAGLSEHEEALFKAPWSFWREAKTATRASVGAEGESRNPILSSERITVALIPKAADDLQKLQDRTSLSKTDIVNRAISVYEFLEAQINAGRDLLVRDPESKESQLIKFL